VAIVKAVPTGEKKISGDLLDRFAKIAGDKYAIRDPKEQAPFLREERDLYFGQTALILKPSSVAEVSAILKLANETRTAVVPQGGNTGLVGGQISFDENAIVLNTTRLNKIREMDAAANTMTCESGVVLARAQEEASKHDRLFPLSLGAEGSCTIGGNLGTNAGGMQALAYGVARDLVLGLEVVLADGRVWNGLRKLKKDNTGYDLRHLFVGSEGTLGVITAAVLKLFPAPHSIATSIIGLKSPQAALDLLNLSQARAGSAVTTFEIMPRLGMEVVAAHQAGARDPLSSKHEWYVLLELSSPMQSDLRALMEEILGEAAEKGFVDDAAIAESEAQRIAFRKLRAGLSEYQKALGGSIKQDLSVPVSAIPAFLEEGIHAVAKIIPGVRPVPFGHMGDGNIHFNFSQPEGWTREQFLARWDDVNHVLYEIIARYGGSISAEHGIGIQKRDKLPAVKDPVEYEMMRSIKKVLDPNGILNPGKVL
jgi:D-lactate dehydrogenase (cytochrome)